MAVMRTVVQIDRLSGIKQIILYCASKGYQAKVLQTCSSAHVSEPINLIFRNTCYSYLLRVEWLHFPIWEPHNIKVDPLLYFIPVCISFLTDRVKFQGSFLHRRTQCCVQNYHHISGKSLHKYYMLNTLIRIHPLISPSTLKFFGLALYPYCEFGP